MHFRRISQLPWKRKDSSQQELLSWYKSSLLVKLAYLQRSKTNQYLVHHHLLNTSVKEKKRTNSEGSKRYKTVTIDRYSAINIQTIVFCMQISLLPFRKGVAKLKKCKFWKHYKKNNHFVCFQQSRHAYRSPCNNHRLPKDQIRTSNSSWFKQQPTLSEGCA